MPGIKKYFYSLYNLLNTESKTCKINAFGSPKNSKHEYFANIYSFLLIFGVNMKPNKTSRFAIFVLIYRLIMNTVYVILSIRSLITIGFKDRESITVVFLSTLIGTITLINTILKRSSIYNEIERIGSTISRTHDQNGNVSMLKVIKISLKVIISIHIFVILYALQTVTIT